ncbi:hypothetical protein ACFLS7_04195 [Bacteroidota bacterium]
MNYSKLTKWLPLFLIGVLFLTSCAPGNEKFDIDPAGFWMGLWHGFISFFTFIMSLFTKEVGIYEVNNSGWPYNLGFILGIMIFYGGGTKGGSRRWN